TSSAGRNDDNENQEYTETDGSESNPKKNKQSMLTNSTLERILKRGSYVNITADNKIYVNSSINLSNGSLTLHTSRGGIKINKDITASDNNNDRANLTIRSGDWLDIHSNISLKASDNINITAAKDIAFENGINQSITGQGTITSGNGKGFRFSNVSLNGVGKGLTFTTNRSQNGNGNITNYFNGSLNVSGNVSINMASPRTLWVKRVAGRTHWNVTTLNISPNSNFNITIDSRGGVNGSAGTLGRRSDLNGISFNKDTTFNVGMGSAVNFDIKTSIIVNKNFDSNYALFNGNISVLGGGRVKFKLDASSNSYPTSGVHIKSRSFNVSGGSSLDFEAAGSTKTAFEIYNDLTLNATGGSIKLRQIEGTDSKIGQGIVAKKT
ncbi:TPA: adhesin, partial [Haemophilus influenzae]